MNFDIQAFLATSTAAATGTLVLLVPKIILLLIVVFGGLLLAGVLKKITIKLLETLKLSELIQNTPLDYFLKGAEIKNSETIIGGVVYWLVLLIVIQSVASILGLAAVTDLIARVLSYIPNIISSVVVLFLGLFVAGLVESLLKGVLKTLNKQTARFIGQLGGYVVMSLAVLAAVSELGIAREFILILFVGLVSAMALGFGLAIGLGGKELVTELLREWHSRSSEK